MSVLPTWLERPSDLPLLGYDDRQESNELAPDAAYVDSSMLGTGKIARGAILGQKGVSGPLLPDTQ